MYPYEGDLDFNDAVVRYHVEVVDDGGATPVTTSFAMSLQVQAIGATRCMGVALRIPAPIASVAEIGRRAGSPTSIDGAPWSDPAILLQGVDYTPDPEGTTLWIADDLRSLCGGPEGFVNTDPTLPVTACERIEFTARFASDPGFDAGDAPFDLFLHECGNRVAQIHLPGFGPTIEGEADPALGTGDSDPLDPYVHRGRPGSGALQGLPWALHIAADPGGHPQERAAITQAWPSIADFAASGGASGTQFWADGEVDPGFVFAEGALGAPLPSPARGP